MLLHRKEKGEGESESWVGVLYVELKRERAVNPMKTTENKKSGPLAILRLHAYIPSVILPITVLLVPDTKVSCQTKTIFT